MKRNCVDLELRDTGNDVLVDGLAVVRLVDGPGDCPSFHPAGGQSLVKKSCLGKTAACLHKELYNIH